MRINQLSLALLHLFREPLQQVMHDALLQPLGAQGSFRWEGYDDAWITLDGMRHGQALLPADWVRHMGQPAVIAPFYGWLVWLNPEGRLFEGASAGAMFMQGADGHMVWVDPDLDAVVVTRWLDPAHHASFIAMSARALGGAVA